MHCITSPNRFPPGRCEFFSLFYTTAGETSVLKKSKESKNQILCHFPPLFSLRSNWNEICLLFFAKKASAQAVPVNLHVTPALSVMIIVEVSRSARNLAALENYSFSFFSLLVEDANAPKMNGKGKLVCSLFPQRNPTLIPLMGLHDFPAHPLHNNTCENKGT